MTILPAIRRGLAAIPGIRRRTFMSMTQIIIESSDRMVAWDDAQLLQHSHELRWRVRRGDSMDQLIPTAFALVRDAARRTYGMHLFPVQLFAGLVMADGGIAEMQTGEGKTLSALPPIFLRALFGRGCHVLSTNDYLAERDAKFASPIFSRLGLTVGVLANSMQADQRRESYACDVTYGTEKEMGFDFLRDRLQQQHAAAVNSTSDPQKPVQRGHFFALVDEADSIMIDQARTPLLIAVNQECSQTTLSLLRWSDMFAEQLKEPQDFHWRPESRSAVLTQHGCRRVLLEPKPHLTASHDSETLCRQIERALTVRRGFSAERDYVVISGKVQIVDESTGRILEGRKWQDRLHHAIEVRENLNISPMTRETARISVQSYLRLYRHLAGMTGTAMAVRKELSQVYGVRVHPIPVHVPSLRKLFPPRIFETMTAKLNAVVSDVRLLQRQGRAVLVGTPSVRASEMLSEKLREHRIHHELLHARHDQHEADIVSRAGQPGNVVVATNMAGRGTDIPLSAEVRARGGLHVIATEMHSSERIDRQLIGRTARRGDPGSYQLFLSFEDELLSSVPHVLLRRVHRNNITDASGEVSARYLTIFEKARRTLERSHEVQRRQLLIREKQVRELSEEIGLDPWLESFDMNQGDD